MQKSMQAFTASLQDVQKLTEEDSAAKRGFMRRASVSVFDLHSLDDSLTLWEDEPEVPHEDAPPSVPSLKHRRSSFSADPVEKTGQLLAVAWAAGMTIGAGCSSTVAYEMLNKSDRGCSHFIQLVQNLYAMIECMCIEGPRTFFVDRKMPWSFHVGSALFEFVRMAFFNQAVDMGLPMPVVLIIKNSGLIVSVLLGVSIQGKKYSRTQIVGILAITLGVLTATFALRPVPKATATAAESLDGATFSFAIALMLAGVVVTALMNVFQEKGFREQGPHFKETAFYSAAFMVPMTLVKGGDGVFGHFAKAVAWSKYWGSVPLVPFPVPIRWLLLLAYMPSAALMKTSCLKLTGLTGQVGNTVTVTVFRFVSLVLSGCVLNAPPYPPLSFWGGGLMVLLGTLGYALYPLPKAQPSAKKAE